MSGVFSELQPRTVVRTKTAEGSEAEKPIRIREIDMLGFYTVMERIERAKLAAPDLRGEEIANVFRRGADEMKDHADSGERIDAMHVVASDRAIGLRFRAAIADVIAANVNTVWNWLAKSRPVMNALMVASTNLEETEAEQLRFVDCIRIAKAEFRLLKESGLLEELSGFFPGPTGEPKTSDPQIEPQPAISP